MSFSRQLLPVAAIVAALFVAVPFMGSTAPGPAVIFVDDDAPFGGDGLTWNTAYRFLQDALADAEGVTEIRVAQGTYKPDQDEAGNVTPGDRLATFQLLSGVSLMGGYAGIGEANPDDRDIDLYISTLSGDLLGDDEPDFENNDENSRHVVTGSGTDESAVLDGVTIAAGNANTLSNRSGGGLRILNGSPTVVTCRFVGNSANNVGGGVYIVHGCPTFTDCTFDSNAAVGPAGGAAGGGGLIAFSSDLTLLNCVFANNTASEFEGFGAGAGLVISQTRAILTGCVFRNNVAQNRGGGFVIQAGVDTVVLGCTFVENASGEFGGGGIATQFGGGDLRVTNCAFTGNTTGGSGGGIFIMNVERLVMTRSAFIGNTASQGGGLSTVNDVGILGRIVANCTFIGNTASTDGGGILIDFGDLYLANCTLSGNTAGGSGAAISSLNSSDSVIGNCIVRGNAPTLDQIFDDMTSESTVGYSDVEGGFPGTGNIDADPVFVDPVNGDFRLSPGSPCIDAGDNTAVPLEIITDLDGNPRFLDDPDITDTGNGDPPIVDMGAFEFQGASCPWDLNDDGVVSIPDLLLLLGDFGSCDGSPADFDGDGCVGVPDLLALIANFGPCPGGECVWDVNGDGVVDQSDLQQVLDNFGPCDGCPEDVNGDGIVNGQDVAAVVTHFGPCP